MAGDDNPCQEALNAGHNAAWEQDWPTAVKWYTRAARVCPDSSEFHIHLGMALLEMSRLEEALKVFKRANQLNPDDYVALEKIADTLERMGRSREAAQQYISVSEIYLGQRDLNKAISNWERATRVTPGLIPIHARLAQAYEKRGDRSRAVYEYLTLAYNFQRRRDTDRAIQAVHRALRLDRRNAQALNTLRALETGGVVTLPEEPERNGARALDTGETEDIFGLYESDGAGERAAGTPGPMHETLNAALSLLAARVMDTGVLDASNSHALQAMELQRQNEFESAISAYQTADHRLKHPALSFNLGMLLVLTRRYDEALGPLSEATAHPDLQLGAVHALGAAYFSLHQHRKASHFLVQTLELVDTGRAETSEEAARLRHVYNEIAAALDESSDEPLAASNARFVELLSEENWPQSVVEARMQLEETLRTEGRQGVREQLAAAHGDAISDTVMRIDRYIRQNLYTLAMDEAHHAVGISPFYLPVHIRMAEVLMREGRVRHAIEKFNMVARAYHVRGEIDRAASILTEVLELAPLDISLRKNLIDLYEDAGRPRQVLEQTIELADTYHQLGNFEQARETYGVVERLIKEIETPLETIVRVKHRMADIDQLRLELRRAQATYEEIVRLSPDDERARRMLVDLAYRQGNQAAALQRLDQLLGLYANKRQINRILQLLEELLKLHPDDMGIRSRLAAIYQQMGRTEEAVVELDALAEQQLEAGLHRDACETVRLIVSLNSRDVEDYRRLLLQLGC